MRYALDAYTNLTVHALLNPLDDEAPLMRVVLNVNTNENDLQLFVTGQGDRVVFGLCNAEEFGWSIRRAGAGGRCPF